MARSLNHPFGDEADDRTESGAGDASPGELAGVALPHGAAAMLDAMEAPAFLLDEHGDVLYANRPARGMGWVPEWVHTKAELPGVLRSWVFIEGHCLRLVMGWADDHGPGPTARRPEDVLPPRLARLYALLLEGLTDKEVAQRAGLSVATVRTYVRAIYRHLGVHTRAELVRRAH